MFGAQSFGELPTITKHRYKHNDGYKHQHRKNEKRHRLTHNTRISLLTTNENHKHTASQDANRPKQCVAAVTRNFKKRCECLKHTSSLTKKAEPPPTRDVNRDSGTDSANGGWLRRLVRHRGVSYALSDSSSNDTVSRQKFQCESDTPRLWCLDKRKSRERCISCQTRKIQIQAYPKSGLRLWCHKSRE